MATSEAIKEAHDKIVKMYADQGADTEDIQKLFEDEDNNPYRDILGDILDRKNKTDKGEE